MLSDYMNSLAISNDIPEELFKLFKRTIGDKDDLIEKELVILKDSFEMNIRPEIDVQGPLVSDFNVSGSLKGEKASIYISENIN